MDKEETIQHPSSLTTVFLDQPPSCLEFCPADPDHFVVGTYLLSETKTKKQDDGNVAEEEENESEEEVVVDQKKTGSLQLWRLDVMASEL